MHESYKIWLKNGCPKIFCICGCGGEIIIKKSHKYNGICKYLKGHFWRGRHHTEETIQKQHDIKTGKNHPMFGKHQSEETIQKRLKNMPDMMGENSPNFGKHFTKEHKEKIRNKVSGKNNGMYGKSPPHTKKNYYQSPLQGEVCFRSSYELAYAKYLDEHKILWYYEIEAFDLGDMTYTPDFFLSKEEKFIEIKGFMREEAQLKINKFLEQYSWNLEILYEEDLIKLGVKL